MKQQLQSTEKTMQYGNAQWLSSICRPPRYSPSIITYYKGNTTSPARTTYNSNVTETNYIWNHDVDALHNYSHEK